MVDASIQNVRRQAPAYMQVSAQMAVLQDSPALQRTLLYLVSARTHVQRELQTSTDPSRRLGLELTLASIESARLAFSFFVGAR
jgi:hypothetical protein